MVQRPWDAFSCKWLMICLSQKSEYENVKTFNNTEQRKVYQLSEDIYLESQQIPFQ